MHGGQERINGRVACRQDSIARATLSTRLLDVMNTSAPEMIKACLCLEPFVYFFIHPHIRRRAFLASLYCRRLAQNLIWGWKSPSASQTVGEALPPPLKFNERTTPRRKRREPHFTFSLKKNFTVQRDMWRAVIRNWKRDSDLINSLD